MESKKFAEEMMKRGVGVRSWKFIGDNFVGWADDCVFTGILVEHDATADDHGFGYRHGLALFHGTTRMSVLFRSKGLGFAK